MQISVCEKCKEYQNIIGMWVTLGGRLICDGCNKLDQEKPVVSGEETVKARKIQAIVWEKGEGK